MPDFNYAIEIKDRETADLVCAIEPSFAELDYETDLHGSFFVLDLEEGFHIVPLSAVLEYYIRIENGPQIKLKKLIKR